MWVGNLGDLDADGVIDLAVGSQYDDDGGGDGRGGTWVLFMNTDGTVKGQQKISDTQGNFTGTLDNNDFFGISLTSLGDLDGDGVVDLAAGAYGDDDGDTNRGAVWVLNLQQYLDYGDAPSPYPTTFAEDGARHEPTGPTLGTNRDDEGDGTHSAAATADDTTDAPDDEDGVTFGGTILVGQLDASVTVNVQNAGGGAKLDAWIDFNGDGSWGGAGEQIAESVTVNNGNNTIEFDVPSWAEDGATYARFRLSAAGDLGPSGLAADGEVEDYQVQIAAPGGIGFFGDTGQSLGSSQSFGVALGDLDGDGDLDAFAANHQGANKVWLNDSQGTFTATAQSLGSGDSQAVVLGDLDGDGDLDAFVGNWLQGNKVWLNDGSGSFTDSGQSLGTARTRALALGDLDGDGDLDVYAACSNEPDEVWVNNGAGVFSSSGQSLSGSYGYSVALADLDRDGDLDVFLANSSSSADEVWVNDGQGGLTNSGQTLGTASSYGVALGRLNNDSHLDAFITSGGGPGAPNTVWTNNGTGTFTDSGQSLGAARSAGLALGDLDGDGDLDALVGNGGNTADDPNAVWLNDGTGTFVDSGQSLGAAKTWALALGDLDGDGDLDAFVANDAEPNRVWLNAADFGDAPSPYPTTLAENGAQHTPAGPTLGTNRDLENDGTHSAANADDTTGTPDDEDGVTFGSTIMVGQLDASVMVDVQNAGGGAKLDAWIDFNGDGSWGGPGEQIADNVTVTNDVNTINFDVPSWAVDGNTYARFRLSTAGDLGVTGLAADGEVEDYQLAIAAPLAASGPFGGKNSISTAADGAFSVFAADVNGDVHMDAVSASN